MKTLAQIRLKYYWFWPFSSLFLRSNSRVMISDVVKAIKKYTNPNKSPIMPVVRGASGVPPPINMTRDEIIPKASEIHARTLKIVAAIPRNL